MIKFFHVLKIKCCLIFHLIASFMNLTIKRVNTMFPNVQKILFNFVRTIIWLSMLRNDDAC